MGKDGDSGQDATVGLPGVSARLASGREGERIGPYQLVSLLGRGGMGEVHVATQEAPVRRSVALKLLRARRLDPRALAHFEIERQLLAQMRHPAIAQIFDAGTTADGRPYSAMELIEGSTITDYCAREHLPLRARLRLFVRVCEGVQHAHQKGVVHRDLKPGNILVSKIDGRALPKIIDFGIASMMSGGSSDEAGVLGTPAYMSPEQAATPDDIDTRSDIYSLGVLLYQLLCGQRPGRDGPHPLQPSTDFTALSAAEQKDVAATLGVEPAALRGMLSRDLDWVVMKATALDRTMRYASAAELAGDLLRFLDGFPLAAAPPSRAYRWGKFARRQRAGLAAAAIVLAALVAGLGMSLYGLGQARSQQMLAEERARQVEAVSRFQQSMLEELDIESMGVSLSTSLREQIGQRAPDESEALERVLVHLGPADIARGMIDASLLARAEAAIGREFAAQPAVAAALRESVARVRGTLGLHVAASATYGAVADTHARVSGAMAQTTLGARLQQIHELVLAGREHTSAAVELQDQLRPLIAQLTDADPLRIQFDFDTDIIQTLDDQQGRRTRLDALLQRSRTHLGRDAPLTLDIANDLAILLVRLGERKAAGELLEQLVQTREQASDTRYADLRAARQNLAIVKVQSDDVEGAIALQREIVATDARIWGTEHPAALAARGNLANMLDAAGRPEEALVLSDAIVADNTRVMGEGHVQTIRSKLNNASFLARAGRFEEALRLQAEVVDVRNRILGPLHPDTLFVIVNGAATLHQSGRTMEAIARLDRVIPQVRAALGEAHPTAQSALDIRAMVARESGNRAMEIESLETVLAWRSGAQGADDTKTVDTAWKLSQALRSHDRETDAQAVWDRHVAPLLDLPMESRTPAQQKLANRILEERDAA